MTAQAKVKLQVWSLIVVVFVLGGVTGGSLDRMYFSKSTGNPDNRRGPNRMIERMKHDLNLSEEQIPKIRKILEDSRKDFNQNRIINECPEIVKKRSHTRAMIRETLTPEQQKRYDEINAQRDADMGKDR